MNIREAILAAASHIERNPVEFEWATCVTPNHPGCGTPGCALGWIACYMGTTMPRLDSSMNRFSAFYKTMNDLAPGWMDSAAICAYGLRLYADKYHPATERPIQYPDWNAIAKAQTAAPAGEVRS